MCDTPSTVSGIPHWFLTDDYYNLVYTVNICSLTYIFPGIFRKVFVKKERKNQLVHDIVKSHIYVTFLNAFKMFNV